MLVPSSLTPYGTFVVSIPKFEMTDCHRFRLVLSNFESMTFGECICSGAVLWLLRACHSMCVCVLCVCVCEIYLILFFLHAGCSKCIFSVFVFVCVCVFCVVLVCVWCRQLNVYINDLII